MPIISNFAGSNIILKTLYEASGEYNTLGERLDAMESGMGTGVANQVTKLGVTATLVSPYVEEIPITYTENFLLGVAEVLKFVPGEQDITQTICNFDNADSSSFEANDFIIFDGVMKLKTSDTYDMVDNGVLGEGKLFSYTFDRTAFITESISVS